MHEALAWLIVTVAMARMMWMLVRPRHYGGVGSNIIGVTGVGALPLDVSSSDTAHGAAG